jgi:hypothetical protein
MASTMASNRSVKPLPERYVPLGDPGRALVVMRVRVEALRVLPAVVEQLRAAVPEAPLDVSDAPTVIGQSRRAARIDPVRAPGAE